MTGAMLFFATSEAFSAAHFHGSGSGRKEMEANPMHICSCSIAPWTNTASRRCFVVRVDLELSLQHLITLFLASKQCQRRLHEAS